MKSLNLLVKIKTQEIEAIKIKIVQTENEIKELEQQVILIKEKLEKENQFTEGNISQIINLYEFTNLQLNKIKKIESIIKRNYEKIEQLKNELAEAYQENKKYTIAIENYTKIQKEKEKKREQQELDNIGLTNFIYNKD